MAIAALNINGLRYHHDEIKFLLNDKRIHILALNETKLDGSIPKELKEISGYQQLRLDRTCNGGGVSIYVRDSIKMRPRVDVPSERLELLCVEISPPKSKPLLLLLGTDHQVTRLIPLISWKKPFLSSTRRAKKSFSLVTQIVILPRNQLIGHRITKHIFSLYELFSFKLLIEEPTRVTLNTATVIDHVAITCPRNIIKSGVLEFSLSDHYMVYCIRKFNGAVEKGHKKIKTRKMKNFNEEAFLADVSGICWEQMLTETDDINVLVNYWSEMSSLIIEKHAPLIEMRVSEKYCPWIDKDLRDLMRTRDKLKKSAVKGKSPILMDSYRKICNKVNARNAQLKKQHYSNRVYASNGNMKESWKAINELLKKRSKSSNFDCLKESGTELRNKKDVSNAMNNFFCTISRNLADKIQPAANTLLSGEYEFNKDKAKFNFKTIEVKDIRDAFAKVKTTMSFGNDNIYSYF